MSRLRLLGFSGALVAAALIGGTILSAVSAASPAPATNPAGAAGGAAVAGAAAGTVSAAPAPAVDDVGEYCKAFRAAFAANLGKSEADVVAAAKAAIDTTIDQAVSEGKITAAVGDRLKARVAAAPGDGCGLLNGSRWKIAKAALGVAKDGLTAAADALDLTPAQLRAELRAGKDLKAIAATQNVPYDTVSAAIVGAVKADLDGAVAAGTITQQREDRLLARLQARLADGTWRQGRNQPASAPGQG